MDGNTTHGGAYMSPAPTVVALGEPPIFEVTIPRPYPGPAGPIFVPTKTLRRWFWISEEDGKELALQGPTAAQDEFIYPMVDGPANEVGFLIPTGRYTVRRESGPLAVTGHDEFFDGVRIFPLTASKVPGAPLADHLPQGLPIFRRQMATLGSVAGIPGLGAELADRVPLVPRVRLRQVSHALRDAVDGSLSQMAELYAEDLSELGAVSGAAALIWLAGKCPNLVKVTAETRGPGREGARPGRFRQHHPNVVLTDASVTRLAERCPGLRYVHLGIYASAVVLPGQEPLAGDKGLAALATQCAELRFLEMPNVNVTDAGLESLGERAGRLEHLALHAWNFARGAAGVGGKGVGALARGCRQLKFLDIVDCLVDDEGMRAVGECCLQLRHLNIAYCRRVTDAGMAAVAAGCGHLMALVLDGCDKVSDASLETLARNCAQLREFKTCRCPGVTDGTVRALGTRCRGLEKLIVNGCGGVTDESVTVVAANCPRLQVLGVAACVGVTDGGIGAVGQGCPCLALLDVTACGGVTDASITVIARNCPGLEVLKAVRCPGVTDESITVFAREPRPGLRMIDVYGCPGVSERCRGLFKGTPCVVEGGGV
eukprot:jgi/Mesvir1/17188/Mv07608-RA.1